ncbi:uncharacterized protein LOC134187287 [Corticium candelabrum]|uniref:uncharacterized protein LOC134187287 n=1 Tax=Corticium candelabrum TaxID=121492 RepID=UPI002E25DA68|nr:uncharacterized protein LOC134187287 [Corticium candelabrum]
MAQTAESLEVPHICPSSASLINQLGLLHSLLRMYACEHTNFIRINRSLLPRSVERTRKSGYSRLFNARRLIKMSSENRVVVRAPIDRLGEPGHRIRSFFLTAILYGTPLLVVVQKYRSPPRDIFMKVCSFFGTEDFYTLIIPILLWIVDGRLGRLFLLLLAVGFYVTGILKNTLCLPRPPSPAVVPLEVTSDWALPSLHAVNGVICPWYIFFYAYIHYEWTATMQTSLFLVTIVWSFMVMFSRLYLGVHSPADIVSGGFIGCGILAIWLQVDVDIDTYVRTSNTAVLMVIVWSAILAFVHPHSQPYTLTYPDSVVLLGLSTGLVIGTSNFDLHVGASTALLDRPNGFTLPQIIGLSVLRFVVGSSILLLVRIVMKKVCRPVISWCTLNCGLTPVSSSKIVVEHPTNMHYTPAFTLPGEIVADKNKHNEKDESMTAPRPSLENSDRSVDIDIPVKYIVYSCMGWFASQGAPLLFHLMAI